MRALKLGVGVVLVLLLGFAGAIAGPAQPKPKKQGGGVGPLAVNGSPSSLVHCVTGEAAAVHSLGWLPPNKIVRLTFESTFDPIATVTLVQQGQAQAEGSSSVVFWVDDDSGGNLEPYLEVAPEVSGTMTLHVSSWDASAGCYLYKVEVMDR